MALTLRQIRRRTAWLLAIPFLLLSRPTAASLGVGVVICLAGLALRAWAAGTIEKDRRLVTHGPYAWVRSPLYLGSLFVGLGVTLAGGHWIWPVVFVLYFSVVYGATVRREDRLLEERFPESFSDYAARVRVFVPRRTPYLASQHATGGAEFVQEDEASDRTGGFAWGRYVRNREWEAGLGALAAFGLLAARVVVG